MTAIGTESPPAKIAERTSDEPKALSPQKTGFTRRLTQIAVPVVMLVSLLLLWQGYVTVNHVPHYILPSPLAVAQSLHDDWPILFGALLNTLEITFSALALALIGGVALALLMAQSRLIELAVYPYAVILQVTPVVAIAPLIIIYAPTTYAALLICAFLVAFFPILSNTVQGLKSTDHNLLNLFELYGAGRLQTLLFLKIPSALPYFLTGLKISGGLSLIAAVVAEFVAGSAGAESGLAFRLLESKFRLNIPRLYAALVLLSLSGVLIFLATSLTSHLLLRKWHESSIRREN
jgi:NitT/TauT family transport system permease protein